MKTEIPLAEKLHIWYLEATKELDPKSYNPNAQKSYKELSKEQRFIDKYIADKIKKLLIQAKKEENKNKLGSVQEISDDFDDKFGKKIGNQKLTYEIIEWWYNIIHRQMDYAQGIGREIEKKRIKQKIFEWYRDSEELDVEELLD